MNYSNFKPPSVILIMAVFALSFFMACEDDDTDENDETQTWEPYQVEPNTAFEYDYEKYDSDTLSSSGSFKITVGEPKVTITGTIDDMPFEVSSNTSDDPKENFEEVITNNAYTGVLYHTAWPNEFDPEEVEVGDSFSYTYGDKTLSFNVTGKATYADYEGYVVKMEYQDESISQSWEACVNKNVPLTLMTRIIDNEEEWYFELTNYEE